MSQIKKTNTMVMTAMIMCIIMVATWLFKIPTPFQGYVHLGDAMIFLGVLVLGKKNGTIAAAFGSALSDLLGGYVIFSIWTFVIKGLMAFVMGWCIEMMMKKSEQEAKGKNSTIILIVGMIVSGLVMAFGYALANGFVAGNMITGLLSIPQNCGQFGVGLVLAWFLSTALYKTPAKKYFYYQIEKLGQRKE